MFYNISNLYFKVDSKFNVDAALKVAYCFCSMPARSIKFIT